MKTTDEKPLTKFERIFCLVVAILYSAVIYWRFFFATFHREDF